MHLYWASITKLSHFITKIINLGVTLTIYNQTQVKKKIYRLGSLGHEFNKLRWELNLLRGNSETINPEYCQNVKKRHIFVFENSPSRCMPCPIEWNRGRPVRSGIQGQRQEPLSSAPMNKRRQAFGLEKLVLLLTGNCLVSLNSYPCHKWGPFSGSDSTVSTLITNRISEYGAKCFLPSNFQIAGLRPNGDTSPLLVTCRCILKKDSHKNYIKIHKHRA